MKDINTRKFLIVGQENISKYKQRPAWSIGKSSKRLWTWYRVNSYKELKKIADTFNVINRKEEYLDDKINKGRYDMIFLVGKVSYQTYEKCKFRIRHEHMTQRLLHPSGLNVSCNFKDEEMRSIVDHALLCRKLWRLDNDQ